VILSLFYYHLLKIFKIFIGLGNNRPKILVELEDCVLRAIIAISEGKSLDHELDALHSQISSLEKDLANDEEALGWFNLVTSAPPMPPTPPASAYPSTPSAGACFKSI